MLGRNPETASNTVGLESSCGRRNVWCSGEMHRYHEEPRLRRQPSGPLMTLMLEGAGIKQD